uniref:RING-type domain-containing protein n=1 Tax=Rhodosorus marinus TaxID=101924 RepID=A0A7S3EJ28_9RHOD|mmetsp:Transcript_40189/g.159721  ORF Transcript_40189/g.159721 Transcript_40189/m.159721 type:complete len:213 (+) Transcript_40189:592-1230(+)|eukprot:CAMPEP_0113959278 /NCGR_PEP_ID=MMETSP0011_2-20120614/4054_1 /TAXON_ID=101924 /ORGANISM="Rhodosorus marinus" /LENGTH=212 /DNA_ID=CAMNT_0000970569 /DNA_START=375 /DNA_END=1013 /DNA_ORIENTATION=- /assembly_acc=CAM_ASM_000156
MPHVRFYLFAPVAFALVFLCLAAHYLHWRWMRRRSRREEFEFFTDDTREAFLVELGGIQADGSGTRAVEITQEAVEKGLVDLSDKGFDVKQIQDEVCSICLEEFVIAKDWAETVFIAPPCKHAYHVHCLSKWVYTRGDAQCPICKTPFVSFTRDETDTPLQTIARTQPETEEDISTVSTLARNSSGTPMETVAADTNDGTQPRTVDVNTAPT